MSARESRNALFGCHEAVFLDYVTKAPLIRSRLVTNISVTQSGELTERTGGSLRFPLAHFENRGSLEIQLTLKDWEAALYRIACGAQTTDISTIATAATIVEESFAGDAAAGNLVLTADGTSGTPLFGYYRLSFDGTKWSMELIGSPDDPVTISGSDFVLAEEPTGDITTTAADFGSTGFKLKLGDAYTAKAGDAVTFRVFPTNKAALAAHYTQIRDGDRKPYVSAIFSAEGKEGHLFNIYIERMKCSSGLPVTMAEKTDNEYQLSFMASVEDRTQPLWEINQVI